MPRLDRVVSHSLGLKRPAARELILEGRVKVSPPCTVIESPSWLCLTTDTIEVDLPGEEPRVLQPAFHRLAFMHKPVGVISERKHLRDNVYKLLPPDVFHQELGTFGRLDRDTTGLLIFGTDGGLCHLATDPNSHLPKVYSALCRPNLGLGYGAKMVPLEGLVVDAVYHPDVAVAAFASGLILNDGTQCKPAQLEWCLDDDTAVARVTLSEGKYHQVKKMLAAVGAHVVSLHREAVGTLSLSALDIAVGEVRVATEAEVVQFCSMFPATPKIRDNPNRAGGGMA
eukprot:m.171222 g.171222  ORF g.171222 m.171222 type:complete len:284 (-) comp24224_c0_seq4:760-1611(-)